ncbi:MAG: inositol monophosphatase family protein [Chromatiaceae bacterium]|nr:MAG: inositol monophosphatase family protein [Chromatiaceae bacterium]
MSADPVHDLPVLADLLREVASDEILARFGAVASQHKADGSLVTAADLAVQQRLGDALAARYPTIPLLGEEMERAEQVRLLGAGDAAVWCLDPLDGTSNFACGYPGFAISLALVRGGRVDLGLVLDPVRDDCFSACRGGGATLNGAPIAPFAPHDRLGECIAAVDLKRVPPARIADLFAPGSFRSQRNLGSVALDWCWLAAGRFQLYLHGGQGLWDYAAGRLIAQEAGAASHLFPRGSAVPSDAIDLDKRVAVGAATPALLTRWLALIQLPF